MTYRTHTEFVTKLPPSRVIQALTDFSPDRPSVWRNIDPEKYRVHEAGDKYAVVTEGNRKPDIWARERYDWSEPNRVTWTVQESNFCAPGSSVTATVTEDPGGGSRVSLDWQRSPTTWSSRLFLALIPLMKDRMLGKDMQQTLDRVAEEGHEQASSDLRAA